MRVPRQFTGRKPPRIQALVAQHRIEVRNIGQKGREPHIAGFTGAHKAHLAARKARFLLRLAQRAIGQRLTFFQVTTGLYPHTLVGVQKQQELAGRISQQDAGADFNLSAHAATLVSSSAYRPLAVSMYSGSSRRLCRYTYQQRQNGSSPTRWISSV